MITEEIKAGNKIILDGKEYLVVKSYNNSCLGCAFFDKMPCPHLDKCMSPDNEDGYIFIDNDKLKE